MYDIVSSVSAGIETRARRAREGPEKVMQVFGVQEWLRREERRERERPSGSRVGVVRVWVFVRIYGVVNPSLSKCEDEMGGMGREDVQMEIKD